jgi:CRP/FNR family transcriptional regulator, cyclic AMP receptor protein
MPAVDDLLAGLTDEDRRALTAKMPRRAFKKGDTLFHEGDPGDSLHVIAKGRVAIRISTPNADVVTLTVLGPGSSFGEQALLTAASRRTASAVALDAVETRMLHRNDFEELRRRQPSTERFLVELLAAQVRRLSAQVLDALYESADTRVIRRIADLIALYEGGRTSFEIPVKQEDLASMAGTTRPTANRVLKQLEDDGVLVVGRGRIDVLDAAAILRRAR